MLPSSAACCKAHIRLKVCAWAGQSPVLFLSQCAGVGISRAARLTIATAHGPTSALVVGAFVIGGGATVWAAEACVISTMLRSVAIMNMRIVFTPATRLQRHCDYYLPTSKRLRPTRQKSEKSLALIENP